MKPVNPHHTYRQPLKDGVLTYDAEGVKRLMSEAFEANVPPARLLDDSLLPKVNGVEVMDLGRDVKVATFVKRAEEMGARIMAAFSLMSTTRAHQREIIEALERASYKGQITVLVGGDPCTLEWTQSYGVDGYGHDAVEAVVETKWLLGIWEGWP